MNPEIADKLRAAGWDQMSSNEYIWTEPEYLSLNRRHGYWLEVVFPDRIALRTSSSNVLFFTTIDAALAAWRLLD